MYFEICVYISYIISELNTYTHEKIIYIIAESYMDFYSHNSAEVFSPKIELYIYVCIYVHIFMSHTSFYINLDTFINSYICICK